MVTNLADEYAKKTDDELLRLALEMESLTQEGQDALKAIMRSRHLDIPSRLERFRDQENDYLQHKKTNIGNLTLMVPGGMGRRMRGMANVEQRGIAAEYDTTLFFIFLWFPLIPLGTYRVSKVDGSKTFRVLDKKPLNWQQVFLVWLKAAVVVAAIILALRFWDWLGTVK